MGLSSLKLHLTPAPLPDEPAILELSQENSTPSLKKTSFALWKASGHSFYDYGVTESTHAYLQFTNCIASVGCVRIEPPALELTPIGNSLTDSLSFKGKAEPGTYKIFLDRVVDVGGHSLENVSTTVTIAPGDPYLLGPQENVHLLPQYRSVYRAKALHTSHVLVEGRQVVPEAEVDEFHKVFFGRSREDYSFGGGVFRERPQSLADWEIEQVLADGDEAKLQEIAVAYAADIAEREMVLEERRLAAETARSGDWEEIVPVSGSEVKICLKERFQESSHVVLNLRPCKPDGTPLTEGFPICVWLQAANVRIAAFRDRESFRILVLDRISGHSVSGARVTAKLEELDFSATTDSDGWAVFEVTEPPFKFGLQRVSVFYEESLSVMLLTRRLLKGVSSVFIPIFIWTDRTTYRVGDTVHIKGWVRSWSEGDTLHFPQNLSLRLESQYTLLHSDSLKLNPHGSFELSVEIPKLAAIGTRPIPGYRGNCVIRVIADERSVTHSLMVREFRQPGVEVVVVPPPGPLIRGSNLEFEVRTRHRQDEDMAQAPIAWSCTAEIGEFKPPGYEDFRFGLDPFRIAGWTERVSASSESVLDNQGGSRLAVRLEDGPQDQTLSVQVSAIVNDPRRSSGWETNETVLLHSSNLCVGLRVSDQFCEPDALLSAEVVVTDLRGRIVSGHPVELTCGAQKQSVLSGSGPVGVTFLQDGSGFHDITATVRDEEGRESLSSVRVWSWSSCRDSVSSGSTPPSQVALILEREVFTTEETVRLIVLSPFPRARGVLRLGDRIVHEFLDFEVRNGWATLELPLSETMVPNIFLRVDLLACGNDGHSTCLKEIRVLDKSCILNVVVEATDGVCEPLSETTALVRVRDWRNRPVKDAEVCLTVVDEAFLASKSSVPDPWTDLYSRNVYDLHEDFLSDFLLPQELNLDELYEQRVISGRRWRTYDPPRQEPEPKKRPSESKPDEKLVPTAHFEPSALTDEDGTVAITFTLGPNVTRYRMTALVSSGPSAFGRGEGFLTARR